MNIINRFKEWINRIKVVDVILHKNERHSQVFLVLNRSPTFLYKKEGNYLIGRDGDFFNFYRYEKPQGRFKAFAGREFDIPLIDGSVIKANGQWWHCGDPEMDGSIISASVASIEELEKWNVFFGICMDKNAFNKVMRMENKSNNYYKYDKRLGRDLYLRHRIISKFDTQEAADAS